MSKIKKALKKIGKAALIAGAGYAAMKGLKNRKENLYLIFSDIHSNKAYSSHVYCGLYYAPLPT